MTVPNAPASRNRRQQTKTLFDRATGESPGDVRTGTLDEIVLLNVPVARSIARLYRDRGCDLDDLEQTACLALVRAVEHYDPSTGHDFLAYAVPSIRGELMKYFRDHGWMVRPPRSVQELQPLLRAAEDQHQQLDAGALSIEELAARVGVAPKAVRKARMARGCFAPTSLDRPVGDVGSAVLGDLIPYHDPGFAAAEARALLGWLLANLSHQDRSVLQMRYVDELTQAQMAAELRLTQPRVSRLLQRILTDLRDRMAEPARPLRHSA